VNYQIKFKITHPLHASVIDTIVRSQTKNSIYLIYFSMAIYTGDFQDTKCPMFYASSTQFFLSVVHCLYSDMRFSINVHISLLNMCGYFTSVLQRKCIGSSMKYIH